MSKNERTGKKVGSLASEALRDRGATKRERSIAASALTQRPSKLAPQPQGGPRFIVTTGSEVTPGQISLADLRLLRTAWSMELNGGEAYDRIAAWLDAMIGAQQ